MNCTGDDLVSPKNDLVKKEAGAVDSETKPKEATVFFLKKKPQLPFLQKKMKKKKQDSAPAPDPLTTAYASGTQQPPQSAKKKKIKVVKVKKVWRRTKL